MSEIPGMRPHYDDADEKADAAHDEWVRDEADLKNSGEEKTINSAREAFKLSVQELANERERLVAERGYLISIGVDPNDLEPIDSAEAIKAFNKAHPLYRVDTGEPLPPGVKFYTKPSRQFQVNVPPEVCPPSYKWDGHARGKDSNPKDAIGSRKVGLSMLPKQVLYEVALAMLEGSLKYARHNYRVAGVRASVYYDANGRHLDAWWEGQDSDPGSGLHHIVKAIASLIVLRDSMLAGNWYDDRPPSIGDPNWLDYMNKEAERIIDAFEGEPKQPFIKGDNE